MNLYELRKIFPEFSIKIKENDISYEDFIEDLYKDLDRVIVEMESSRQYWQFAHHNQNGEDSMTDFIKVGLRLIGYDASHNEKTGGHVDLLVKKNDYRWIAEAKIYRDYQRLLGGFEQLCRYTSGNDNQRSGALLIYIYNSNAKKTMATMGSQIKARQ